MQAVNELYPIFLKADQLKMIIIGGGNVALEKLTFLLKSSPNANVKLVSIEYLKEVEELADKHQIVLIKDAYNSSYLKNEQIIIAATNDRVINNQIYKDAKAFNIPINVADTPDLCDFYLGGIVTKGNVKIAISTNGTSPTLAKRLRQLFEQVLPDNINELALTLNEYRNQLKGDFESKIENLNNLTKDFLNDKKL